MGMVKVVNDNVFEHKERFKGLEIVIPAGGYVEMEREDAVLFKSQFKVPKFGKDKIQLTESFKMIKLVPIEEVVSVPEIPKEKDLTCMACGFESKSAAGLAAHIRQSHKDQMLDEDEKKKMEF